MNFFSAKSDPGTNLTVSKEDVNRQLFSRLVVELGRETSQSTNVMAFILWVEKKTRNPKIVQSLLKWSSSYLSLLADEVVMALSCIERCGFPSAPVNETPLPLIQSIMCREITLQCFLYNRFEIINAVTMILNDVCVRAFTDIVHHVQYVKAMKEQSYYAETYYGAVPYNPYYMQQVVYCAPAPAPGVQFVPQQVAVTAPHWNELGNSKARHDDSQLKTCDALGKLNFSKYVIEGLAKLGINEVDDDSTRVLTPRD